MKQTDKTPLRCDPIAIYEISFTRHFYKPQPLRTLAIEQEAEGLIDDLLKGGVL
jgi:hypothetical protein